MNSDEAKQSMNELSTTVCELCGRQGVELTKHHLIPRMRHRNKRVQRMFERDDMTSRILWVCRPCHNHIHATFSEKQLALEMNTLECLLTHADIASLIDWIRTKPAGFKPKSQRRK